MSNNERGSPTQYFLVNYKKNNSTDEIILKTGNSRTKNDSTQNPVPNIAVLLIKNKFLYKEIPSLAIG